MAGIVATINKNALLPKKSVRNLEVITGTLTIGAADTYLTGGFDVSAIADLFKANVGFSVPRYGAYDFYYEATNKKIIVLTTADGLELANASAALRGLVIPFVAVGRRVSIG